MLNNLMNYENDLAKLLSFSHIIFKNPVLEESQSIKKEYYDNLKNCLYFYTDQITDNQYIKSQMDFYYHMLFDNDKLQTKKQNNVEYYQYFFLLDLIHITGGDPQVFSSKANELLNYIYSIFPTADRLIVALIIDIANGNYGNLKKLKTLEKLANTVTYIEAIEENLKFANTTPFKILVTATMSAGKSTFINAITGKSINLSKNMACTSKIHSIISKSSEDGFSYEYDHDLVLMASKKDLFEDNSRNTSNEIIVSTFFNGTLGGNRIIINDSPGVNFSENSEHAKITYDMVKSHDYDLLIYIMNATQLGTNDDDEFLSFIKDNCLNCPIVFIINKIDTFEEDDNISETLKEQKHYLESKGFKNPIVCPTSSKFGYMTKIKSKEKLSTHKKRDFDLMTDRFSQMDLDKYYEHNFPAVCCTKKLRGKDTFLQKSGILYIEKIIENISKCKSIYDVIKFKNIKINACGKWIYNDRLKKYVFTVR